MGKSLAQALQMANQVNDNRRFNTIVTAIEGMTTWDELTEEQQDALIQPHTRRDPRLIECKEWVLSLATQRKVKGKYDQLTRLIDQAIEQHPDRYNVEGDITAYVVLAMEILGLLGKSKELFLY